MENQIPLFYKLSLLSIHETASDKALKHHKKTSHPQILADLRVK